MKDITNALWATLALALLAQPVTAYATPHVDERIDINNCSLAELVALPGIGRKRAIDILHRRLQHPYRRVSELLRIRGIGRRTYHQIRPLVTVGPPRANEVQGPGGQKKSPRARAKSGEDGV